MSEPRHRGSVVQAIPDGVKVGPHDSRQGFASKDGDSFTTEDSVPKLPVFPASLQVRPAEVVDVFIERQFDGLPTARFLRLNWINLLADQNEEALRLLARLLGCPRRSVLADRVSSARRLAAANPILEHVGFYASRCDTQTEASQVFVPDECVFGSRLQ